MTPNDDLARWGEPPASEQELRQARDLAERLERLGQGAPAEPGGLEEVDTWLQMMVSTVLTYSGLAENAACAADAGGPPQAQRQGQPPDLRLRVYRLAAPGSYVLVGSTHPMPTALRDLKRVPDDPDRVALRTGDRARIDAVCDREGFLTVFNVGPAGTFNLLYPDDLANSERHSGRSPLRVVNVQLTPPAGRERLYAVWSRVPLSREHLSDLGRPGVAVRDVTRVQETLDELHPDDWHAVLLVLDHEG
jgi:hypothetical protein